jgi:class 3 adenylate cyclase
MNTTDAFDTVQDGERLDYRYLVAVDVQGFSALSTRDQITTQIMLHRALVEAAEQSGLDRSSWERQVSGDGELSVLPNGADGLRLVADFPRNLEKALAAVNSTYLSGPRLRIRVALHHGTLIPGCFGPVGQAPVVISRLLDSGRLRRELSEDPHTDLALIVSAALYEGVVQTRLRDLDPTEFGRVRIHAKGSVHPAYVRRRGKGIL